MSRCISHYGEYGAHELTDNRCTSCRVWQCPKCGTDEPYPLDGDDHQCAHIGLETVPVPKWLRDDPIAHAQYLRHGVTQAIYFRTRRVLPSYTAYVQGARAGFLYSDRVRKAWLRRHPISRGSST